MPIACSRHALGESDRAADRDIGEVRHRHQRLVERESAGEVAPGDVGHRGAAHAAQPCRELGFDIALREQCGDLGLRITIGRLCQPLGEHRIRSERIGQKLTDQQRLREFVACRRRMPGLCGERANPVSRLLGAYPQCGNVVPDAGQRCPRRDAGRRLAGVGLWIFDTHRPLSRSAYAA